MKKLTSLIVATLAILLFFNQCKKNSPSEFEQKPKEPTELNDLRKQTLTLLLTSAKSANFKNLVLEECLKQRQGDYYVKITDLANSVSKLSGYEELARELNSLAAKTRTLSEGREAILLYPRAETIEQIRKSRTRSRTSDEELYTPVGVYQDQINPDYSSPGYIVDNGFSLIFFQNITEEYAWEFDVWVIGEEENVSDENLIASPADISTARTQGQPEYGGLIQVTNLNAIEHWTAGKLEFKLFVFNSSGVKVSERAFGKWRRSNFRDQKWKDFGHFIGNWNTTTFGNWMYENWWEEDGGQSNSVTITVPPPSGQTGPTISTTIPSKNKDDNLGLATIQFSDPISQVYNITYANIKRRN